MFNNLNIDILKSFINNDSVKVYYEEGNTDNIIVEGNIIVFPNDDYTYNEFPVKIHKVIGNIHWYGGIRSIHESGTLHSLKNFPDIVEGDVIICKNPYLTSLEGCPSYIGGTLQCDFCNIKSIEGISKYIGNNCILNNNPIDDISLMSNIEIHGNISIINTPAAYNINKFDNIMDTSIVKICETSDLDFSNS